MQSKPLKFNPICGTEFKTDECFAGTFRTGSVRQWFFNPWTGTERASQDVVGDPHGLLIHDGESDVKANNDRCPKHPRYVAAPFCPDCRSEAEQPSPAAAREALHYWAEMERQPDPTPWPEQTPAADDPSFPYPQNKPVDTLTATLGDRGAKYGKFTDHAAITQSLKYTMYNQPKWEKLTDDQKEALEMIAHKIGRILNGDPNYADSWIDIAGYAMLVADRLDGASR